MLLITVNKWSFRVSKKTAKKLADAIYAKLYGHADEFIGDWILQNGLLARVEFRVLDSLFGYYLTGGIKHLCTWNSKGNYTSNGNFNLMRKMTGTSSHNPQEWEGINGRL